MVSLLPHVNATLNFTAALLLMVGWWFIRSRREAAHKLTMLSAFAVSVLFLVCYLVYHFNIGGGKRFPSDAAAVARYVYLTILITHSVLAALVPLLAIVTIYLGIRDLRSAHRRLARWTLPIWLYVSVTGVVIYVMLYHLYA